MIHDFDTVYFSWYMAHGENNRQGGLRFKKNMPNGDVVIYELISKKRNVLTTQTDFIADNQNKKPDYLAESQQRYSSTSETTGTSASTEILSSGNISVKSSRMDAPTSMKFSTEDYDYSSGGMGRGYAGYSMSVNAQLAYDNGEMPRSKWTKSKLIDGIANIDAEKAQKLKKANASVLAGYFLEKTAWHHTSEYYNVTDFYGINADAVEALKDSDIDKIIAEKPAEKIGDTKTYKGDFEYIEWSGTRNHPKSTTHKLSDVTICSMRIRSDRFCAFNKVSQIRFGMHKRIEIDTFKIRVTCFLYIKNSLDPINILHIHGQSVCPLDNHRSLPRKNLHTVLNIFRFGHIIFV